MSEEKKNLTTFKVLDPKDEYKYVAYIQYVGTKGAMISVGGLSFQIVKPNQVLEVVLTDYQKLKPTMNDEEFGHNKLEISGAADYGEIQEIIDHKYIERVEAE